MTTCIHCEVEFNLHSPEKQRAGGRANECIECSEETAIKYLGLQSADGKAAGVTILAFNSQKDKEVYSEFWKNNSGMHKGKSCQLGDHLTATPRISFRKVHEQGLGMNHKGKAC